MEPLTIQQAKDKAAQELCNMDWHTTIQMIIMQSAKFSRLFPNIGTEHLTEKAMQIYCDSQNQELAGKYYEASAKIGKLEKELSKLLIQMPKTLIKP